MATEPPPVHQSQQRRVQAPPPGVLKGDRVHVEMKQPPLCKHVTCFSLHMPPLSNGKKSTTSLRVSAMGHSTSAEVKKQQIEGEDLCRNMLALRYGKDPTSHSSSPCCSVNRELTSHHITSQKDIALLPPELVNETRRLIQFA
ncbi:hypothetical protein F2P79_001027 [Pimephales promelas]|nr:hypothetical protein F2P79_001027 [Pimephales promelas]